MDNLNKYPLKQLLKEINLFMCAWLSTLICLTFTQFSYAQEQPLNLTKKEFVIGTKVAKPFAMKDKDGRWYGISIELWEIIARKLDINFTWKEHNLKTLLDGVESGALDVGIAAITITSDREKRFDFSHSYYSTGLSIAVPKNLNDGWQSIIRGVFSRQMFVVLMMLALVLLVIGSITWILERKRNPDNFNPNPIKGIAAGIWWAAVTMTTVGYGDMTPKTLGGRLMALIWMFVSMLMVSAVIASVASSLTLAKSKPLISGPEDLPKARIASINGSSSDTYLIERHLNKKYFSTVLDGLKAIEQGKVDAIVYDDPLLKYLIQQHFQNKLIVVEKLFEHQNYGIAFPEGSPLREPVNRIMLKIIHRDEWQRVLNKYFGY